MADRTRARIPSHCRRCERPMQPTHGTTPGLARHRTRGLCNSCHHAVRRNGTLDDYDRVTWARQELLTEAARLKACGLDEEQMTAELGVKPSAIERARYRQLAAQRLVKDGAR